MGSTGQQYYRRQLPDSCIAFNSKEGRSIFKEALGSGYMECYFGLASQFRTQDEPAYCGLATLVMVLNTLEVDPKRIWKGVWRWYHEDMLSCGIPLEHIKKSGINMEQFACLAGCNSLEAKLVRAVEPHNEDTFRKVVMDVTQGEDAFLVLNYSRPALKQTGTEHYSPVAGYHPGRDLVLVLDTARFKYPPYWVSLPDLWKSMEDIDPETGLSRGYFILRRSITHQLIVFGVSSYLMAAVDNEQEMTCGVKSFITSWNGWVCERACTDVNESTIFQHGTEKLVEYLKLLVGDEHLMKSHFTNCPHNPEYPSKEHWSAVTELLESLRNTTAYKGVANLLKEASKDKALRVGQANEFCHSSARLTMEDFISVLLLMWPYGSCPGTNGRVMKGEVDNMLKASSQVLRSEITMLNQQVQSLLGYMAHCACVSKKCDGIKCN